MNSMSKGYYNDDCKPCRKEKDYCHDDYDHCKKEKDLCPTIIKCGGNGAATVTIATPVGTTFRLAALNLDTSKLCNPIVKIEVANNILVTAITTGGILTFQVNKRCSNDLNPIPVGMPWTLNPGLALTSASTFTFFVCDCGFCNNDCCTYSLDVTVTTPIVTAGTITITNAVISAIATCGSQCC